MHFLGVSLQLRILAEGFMDDCLKFLNSDEKYPSTESFNFLLIYEKFIKSKYEIYLEKILYNQDVVNNTLCDIYNEIHQLLALRFHYSGKHNQDDHHYYIDDVQIYLNNHFQKQNHESIAKSIEIVPSIGEDGEIYFIHRTFAEYFIAQFVVVNCVNNSDSEKHSLAEMLDRKVIDGN
ncbi:hypothetical protein CHUAL_013876 [Chamberlinius hualienensis]